MRMRDLGTVGFAVLLFGCAASTFAADRAIQNGIDTWRTTEDGSTYIDFAKTPRPAGFFCAGSAPFTGRVALRGEPIVTDVPKALGMADTIVQRLDDAAFNKRGVAVTRIQFRALSLKGIEPIETGCGKFTVTASLDGNVQPVTRMVITRESEKGGSFTGPLSLNVKMSFQPVGQVGGEALEFPVPVRFPGDVRVPWRSKTVAPEPAGFVRVDTDGDRVPDTYLPGTSNFIAGQSASRQPVEKIGGRYICHAGDTPDDRHCFYLCDGCQIP
jgi:hypothetical protein